MLGEHRIELSGEGMLRQAKMTAHDYMLAASYDIDEIFGKGTAKKNPALVAAYMQAAAIDLAGASIAQQVRAGLDNIADALREGFNCDAQRTDHPLMGETLDGISDALSEIAAALGGESE